MLLELDPPHPRPTTKTLQIYVSVLCLCFPLGALGYLVLHLVLLLPILIK